MTNPVLRKHGYEWKQKQDLKPLLCMNDFALNETLIT